MRKYLLFLILLTGNLIYSQSALVPCDDNINCATAQNISITQTSEAASNPLLPFSHPPPS